MAEADRPGGGDGANGSGDDAGRAARLRVYRGGRARTDRARPASPGEVARRLSALERRVEKALAAAGAGRDTIGAEVVQAVTDGTLGALATLQRLTFRDVRSTIEGWSALAGDLEQDLAGALFEALYRYWWRVEAVGLERVPARGRVVVVANRSGALLPYDAFMIRVALATEHPAHRAAHPLLEDWLARLPLLGTALARAGGARGGTAGLRRLLARDEVVVVCPEATPAKLFRDRYRLAQFGRAAFARIAIETGSPIVPVGVIGAEETHPVLARIDLAGRILGLPTLPITPTFPWLGLAGLVPLPSKWILMVGEPLDVAARHAPGDARQPAAVARLRDQVRERLQALVLEGLRRRRSIFRG
jgi:1-acyl-sn-glycerol-3-phosphate acyltransferase